MSEATMTQMPTQTPATPAPDVTATSEAKPGATVVTQPDVKKPDATKADGQPTEAQVAEAIRKFKLVIGGKEQEVDEKTLISMAQMGEGARQKFNQAALMRKQAEDFVRMLKTNPEQVLAHPDIGLDVREWAEKFLYERLKQEQLSPEERERVELKKRVEQMEGEKKEQERLAQEAKFKEAQEHFRENLQNDIIKVLDQSGLPKTPYTIRRMAHHMLESRMAAQKYYEETGVKVEPLGPADVVDLVMNDYIDEHNQLLGALPGDKLLSILKEDVRKKIREAELAAMKGGTKVPQPVPAGEQPPANPAREQPAKKGLTMQEWRERNRKLLEGEE